VEWRQLVPLVDLPNELVRFDVNLAPLQVGNPFCEAKSELKYFEAALVDACTVASPTGPYRRAIEHGKTGYLASTVEEWHDAIARLIAAPAERASVARAALRDVVWTFGPDRRADLAASMLDQALGGREAARAFAFEVARAAMRREFTDLPDSEVVFEHDRCQGSEVTVVVPLHNYEQYIVEALQSVTAQTLPDLDLVIVDDASSDNSLDRALAWSRENKHRFNRLLVLKNRQNAKLGPTRNAAFDAAQTPYVLPLDADNRLLPACVEQCLQAIKRTGAAYAYPKIQAFGGSTYLMGEMPYDPIRFVGGNYIDAMALVSKGAWSGAGGYHDVPFGWEDYDFWCRVTELGLHGVAVGSEPLAEYRVHGESMLTTCTNLPEHHETMVAALRKRHPWLSIAWRDSQQQAANAVLTPAHAPQPQRRQQQLDRLRKILPLLRCPETGQALEWASDSELRTVDGKRRWPVIDGCPRLFPGLESVETRPHEHISNPAPQEVLDMMRATKGPVLNVSAGGTAQRLDHVIEAEVAIFRHTDVIADAHHLPFADASFEGVVSLNAFEHYHDPTQAAAEFWRVLKPGGWIYVRTAFLQPQHEAPWHFFNCTKFGLMKWLQAFDMERLRVSENFNPSYTLSWIASEAEAALRRDVSDQAAGAFARAPMGDFVRYWRDEATRSEPVWASFGSLSQSSQEVIGAGFEYIGRKPIG
jgi:hypothetical protein